ncbi:UNVERIFIED_CONTAM: hypothetical protein GTU68_037704 [Idotea baltica]|nr:hypothetical protein [Idotea baltica]
MLKQAQQMKESFGVIKDELETKRLEGTAGGGTVNVVVSGTCEVLEVKIDPRLLEQGIEKEMIESLMLEATNDALTKAKEIIKQEAKINGGCFYQG